MSNTSICYVVICNEFCIDCRKLFIVCIRKRCKIVLWNRKTKRTTPFPTSQFPSRVGEPVKSIPLEISVKLFPTTLLNVCQSLFVHLLTYRKNTLSFDKIFNYWNRRTAACEFSLCNSDLCVYLTLISRRINCKRLIINK